MGTVGDVSLHFQGGVEVFVIPGALTTVVVAKCRKDSVIPSEARDLGFPNVTLVPARTQISRFARDDNNVCPQKPRSLASLGMTTKFCVVDQRTPAGVRCRPGR